MDDEPEMIRQQMEETKLQLSEKLETLESQIAETVQSTGTAVNATVEAVQETAEAVTEVVQDAAKSVSNAFNLRRQIDKHPLLVLGGAVGVGYLAYELFIRPAKSGITPSEVMSAPPPATDAGNGLEQRGVDTTATTKAAIAAAYESGRRDSSWHQLRDVAIGAMIGVVQDVVSHSVPLMVDQLIGKHTDPLVNGANNGHETQQSPKQRKSPEVEQRLRVAASERVRSDNSY